LVLDTLGCAIAGARAPTVRAWLDGQHLRADPFATANPAQVGPSPGAAMAFAMAACWDEACEGHARAHGRPGVAALAAIWPWAHQLNWGQLLHALVLGYEVGARMGALLRIAPGMHVDANWPSLGSAAAAASALQLSAPQTLTAIHIAACQLPTSLYRPIQTGDTARNTYLGHAAILGQMAAQAAAALERHRKEVERAVRRDRSRRVNIHEALASTILEKMLLAEAHLQHIIDSKKEQHPPGGVVPFPLAPFQSLVVRLGTDAGAMAALRSLRHGENV
jgi:2-methylcitrate dehydratase PrpD